MDPASNALIEVWGPAGVIIVALAGAVIWLANALRAEQRSRVEDAQKVVGVLVDMTKQWHAAISELTRVVERLEEAIDRHR